MNFRIFILVLIPFLLFLSCKKEVQEPFPCPAENDTDGNYLCANVSGHDRYITVGKKTLFVHLTSFAGDFYDVFTHEPNSTWWFTTFNNRFNTNISIGINYPFPLGVKSTNFGHINEVSDAGRVTVWYTTPTQSYVTDSSSIGYFIINGSRELGYTGKFEATLVNVDNPNDKITITDGKFCYMSNYDKYTIYE